MAEPAKNGRISVSNDELVTVRNAMRELNRLVDQLERGDVEKFVLMKGGRMGALITRISDELSEGPA